MEQKESSRWIMRPKSNPRLRLFCFPYAGGSASIFRRWSEGLPTEVEVCPVYLPGREHRFHEPGFTDIHALAEALSDALLSYTDIPFALCGYSMGAEICYVWACHLRKQYGKEPAHMIVAAQRAPQLPSRNAPIHQLPDKEFLDGVYRLGGTPTAAMQNKELMELMLPTLRADFTLYETYTHVPDEPFTCSMSAFYGEQDRFVSAVELVSWREQTRGLFTLTGIPGNHFFLHSAQELFLQAVSRELQNVLNK